MGSGGDAVPIRRNITRVLSTGITTPGCSKLESPGPIVMDMSALTADTLLFRSAGGTLSTAALGRGALTFKSQGSVLSTNGSILDFNGAGVFAGVNTVTAMKGSPSPNLQAFTGASDPVNANGFSAVVYSYHLSRWVVLGQQSSSTAWSSEDGHFWTARTMPATKAWTAVVWLAGNARFVAAATDGTVAESRDGITWTTPTGQLPNSGAWELLVIPGLGSGAYDTVIAISVLGCRLRSQSGISWATITMPTGNWRGVCWHPSTRNIVAVNNDVDGSQIAVSNGATFANFVAVSTPTGAGGINAYAGIACNPYTGRIFTGAMENVGISGQRGMYSDDGGLTWTLVPNNGTFDHVQNGRVSWNALYGFTRHRTLATLQGSPDGVTWTGINGNSLANGGFTQRLAVDVERQVVIIAVGGAVSLQRMYQADQNGAALTGGVS